MTSWRSSRRWRRWHKWVAVSAGAFLALWLVTGIVMVLPLPSGPGGRAAEAPDPRAAVLSPAEAVALLEQRANGPVRVRAVELTGLQEAPVYRIRIRDGGTHLVHAGTGAEVAVDSGLAEQIARSLYRGSGRVRETTRLERHGFRYPLGELPTYRVTFGDADGTVAYVSARSGVVTWSDRWTRLRAGFGALHDFWFLARLTDGRIRVGLLMLTSFVGLLALATGYWLAWPRRLGGAAPPRTERSP